MRQKSLYTIFCTALLAMAFASSVNAAQPHMLCDAAAAQAARASDVPLSVLMSIARVETGAARAGGFYPWPWAANVAGKGHFFAAKPEALEFATALIAQGTINFDVGCFQINLRWHARNFASLEDAFDPATNAAYAAQFLSQLYQEHGTWPAAIASYHSRTQVYASAYVQKVKTAWQGLQGGGAAQTPPPQAVPIVQRVNTFPLLQRSAQMPSARNNGSLLPAAPTPYVPFSLP